MVNAPYLSHLQYNRRLERDQTLDLNRLSSEVSSAGASEDYSSVQNIKELLSQEVILDGVKKFRQDTVVNKQKMQDVGRVLVDLRQITSDFETRVKGFTSNPYNSVSDLQSYASSQLQWMTTLLNKQYAGDYLMAGTASSTPAVMDLTTLSPLALGAPVDTSYYLGSNANMVFRADDNTSITSTVRADHQGIAQLISAFRFCLTIPANELDQRLGTANDLCLQAQQNLIDATAELDSQQIILETTEFNLGDLEKKLEENIQDIGVRSQADAIQDYYQKKTILAITQYVTMNSLTAVRDLIDRIPN